MKEAIVEKLRSVLDGGVDDESKVCYILCQSRKLMDTYPPDSMPYALRLYCNWALHIDLDRSRKTTRDFLQRVDKYVASVFAGKNADIVLEHRMFREFVFLETFRAQLKELLVAYGLPTAVCVENDLWHEFITHYAGIIEDGSLSLDDTDSSLKWVRKVTFSKGKATTDSYVPFDLSWEIELLDQRKYQAITVDVRANDLAGGQAIFYGLTIIPAPQPSLQT